MHNTGQKLEAILFILNDPISVEKLSVILEEDITEVKKAIFYLKNKYDSSESGLCILEHNSHIQLVTKPEMSYLIQKVIKIEERESLTPAALETLSLISYLAPVSKSSLEYIRGVNISFTLRNLLIKGLVEKISHPHKPNTFLYRPSFDLVKHLGISSVEELPEFHKYQELKKEIENE